MLRHRVYALAAILVGGLSIVAARQPEAGPQIRQIRANGVDLAYVEQGQGVPVVFVHGAVGDLRLWEVQRSAFAEQYRFVAYTYRYHGTGVWPDQGKQYSAGTHTTDLAAFISSLNAGPVHLVGLSYGGMLAALVAMKEPALIRTLTLAEPALFSLLAERPDGKQFLDQWNTGAQPVIAAMKAANNTLAVRYMLALVTGDPPENFDTLPPAVRQMRLDNARTLPLMFAAPGPPVTCEMLRAVKTPTLVVRGSRTPGFFSKTAEAVAQCIAGSRLAVISQASHTMSSDNPTEFNREVLAFLGAAGISERRTPR
jgi:pimeloyl-ACP methyl ester carboxylesterase